MRPQGLLQEVGAGALPLADLLCWAFADQEERTKAIEAFRDGKKDVLVATDVASKGLDFPAIQHVINYDMPEEIENYGAERALWGCLWCSWGQGLAVRLRFPEPDPSLLLCSSPHRAHGPLRQHRHRHHLHQQSLR